MILCILCVRFELFFFSFFFLLTVFILFPYTQALHCGAAQVTAARVYKIHNNLYKFALFVHSPTAPTAVINNALSLSWRRLPRIFRLPYTRYVLSCNTENVSTRVYLPISPMVSVRIREPNGNALQKRCTRIRVLARKRLNPFLRLYHVGSDEA